MVFAPLTIQMSGRQMSGRRKHAIMLAGVVQEWKDVYGNEPKEEAKNVHNSLCAVLDSLNSWLKTAEGEARIVENRELGPITKTWSILP